MTSTGNQSSTHGHSASAHTLSRRTWLRGGAMIGAGAALAGLPLGRVALAHGASVKWPSVERLIHGYVESRKVPNMVAALGWGQDEGTFLAAGRDSFIAQRISDADSLYRIYSMTKPITGMAAMILVDEGRMQLDQPLGDVLPAFAKMQVQKVLGGAITPDNLEPAIRQITMRHLLTHTAGLGYGSNLTGPLKTAYDETGIVAGVVSRAEVPGMWRGIPAASLEAFADSLAKLPLASQPGARWHYSVALDLMGRVIEVVSGQSFDSFLQERIFDPIGMASTWFCVPETEKFRFTANYLLRDEQMLPIDLPGNSIFLDQQPFPFGGSGLVSSPRDYDRFLQMLAGYGKIDGKRVMSDAAVRMGTSDLFPATVPTDTGFGSTAGFGAGGRVGKGKDAESYGWGGAAGTLAAVDMRRGLRGSLFTQFMPSNGYPLRSEFPDAVLADAATQGEQRT